MTVTVDFTQLHPAAHATWTAIARLVTATNTQTWAVVGGQMVAVHATIAGVEVPRATDDGDMAIWHNETNNIAGPARSLLAYDH